MAFSIHVPDSIDRKIIWWNHMQLLDAINPMMVKQNLARLSHLLYLLWTAFEIPNSWLKWGWHSHGGCGWGGCSCSWSEAEAQRLGAGPWHSPGGCGWGGCACSWSEAEAQRLGAGPGQPGEDSTGVSLLNKMIKNDKIFVHSHVSTYDIIDLVFF